MITDAEPKIFGKSDLAFIIIIVIIIICVILNWTGLNLNIVAVIYHICGFVHSCFMLANYDIFH
jgi:hypothetical protein